jgi:peptidoglycan/xylan/chitin deacetylase (PgdA/CDA1 family)
MIIKNFLFHRVSDETDAMWPPMKPVLFSKIINHLTRKFEIVPLEAYLNHPADFYSKKGIATILFDDGYKDNIEFAAPVLKKFNCPASFYVVTDSINRNVPTWTYIIDDIFQNTKKEFIELEFDFVPESFKKNYFQINGSTNAEIKKIKPWLKKLSNVQRLEILQSVMQQCNDVAVSDNKMMSWDEIRQLDSAGFTIGSHSHSHPMLASLQSESEITEELQLSASIIKKELNKNPLTISYPIGSYDDRVMRLSEVAGYKYGLAVEQQFFNSDRNNFYKIPRVELYQEPWWKQQLRISGMYSSLKKLWR